jgi:peptide/nickel transport system ATP-binding protein
MSSIGVTAVPPDPTDDGHLLSVTGLSVEFSASDGPARVVDDVSFDLERGEMVGFVGESGSGKTVTSLAIMGLLPERTARIAAGSVRFGGRELVGAPRGELRHIRGNQMAMVFQEPMTSLNPAFTVGNQIGEATRIHLDLSRGAARERAAELLDLVGIPDAHRRVRDYPHAFSGGMRQRAMIAMAIACGPRLLIADEPTTALDVTIQAQILDLLARLQDELGMAVLVVTHDLGIVSQVCQRVVVLYAGQVVEEARVDGFFDRPRHPYSQGLLESMPQMTPVGHPLHTIPGEVPRAGRSPRGCRFDPRCRYATAECSGDPVPLEESDGSPGVLVRCIHEGALDLRVRGPEADAGDGRQPAAVQPTGPVSPPGAGEVLLEVTGLTKEFPVRRGVLRRVVGRIRAVDGIDLEIRRGETLGLVGESGSGKSTVARLVTRLIEPTAGQVHLGDVTLTSLSPAALRRARRDFQMVFQMVFQDPYSSLDPRSTVGASIGEPLTVHEGLRGTGRDERVAELLQQVGLSAEMARRYPQAFSGGQRQRIAIARAIALGPRLVVCDEPVSSLDVSTQSQVINLLAELGARLGTAFLFIAHDLSVVRHISDRIAVMYLGQIVEEGPAADVCEHPGHPYTQALLSAIPDPRRRNRSERILLAGDVPSPLDPPSGCRFRTRCPYAMDVCARVTPPPFPTPAGGTVTCHLHTEGPMLSGQPVTLLRRP